MSKGIFDFESRSDKFVFFGLIIVITVALSIIGYPAVKAYFKASMMDMKVEKAESEELTLSAADYYEMFECSCCGSPISADCCGMAKTRMDTVDELLLDGLGPSDVTYEMVKRFGMDVLMDQSKEEEVREYIKSKAPANPPVISIEDPSYSFGTVSQRDGAVKTSFTIKNTGKSDLVIEGLDTSCMCTTASLTYGGKESPVFGMSMHGENPADYRLSIPPGSSASLNVFYDPNAHGKQTKPELSITRTVTVISNDPVNFDEKVRIDLTQIP